MANSFCSMLKDETVFQSYSLIYIKSVNSNINYGVSSLDLYRIN